MSNLTLRATDTGRPVPAHRIRLVYILHTPLGVDPSHPLVSPKQPCVYPWYGYTGGAKGASTSPTRTAGNPAPNSQVSLGLFFFFSF